MRKLIVIFTILILRYDFATASDDCKTVDLREKGQSMEKSPNFDQQQTTYCWAFAGSQLMSAAAIKQNSQEFNLPIEDVALSPTVTMNQALSEGLECFTPCGLANHISQNRKVCALKDVKIIADDGFSFPDLGLRKSNDCESHHDALTEMETFLDDIGADFSKNLKNMRNKDTYFAYKVSTKNSAYKDIEKQRALSRFLSSRSKKNNLSHGLVYNSTVAPGCFKLEDVDNPFVGSPLASKVLKSIPQTNLSCTEFRTQQFQKAVENENRCPVLASDKIVSSKKLIDQINRVFDSGKGLPIGIDYCYTFLFEGVALDRKPDRLCQSLEDKDVSDHKSLIIGRRLNPQTQKCEYLLRNSFGNDCQKLHKSFQDSCNSEKKKFNAADIWVSSELLEKVVHGISLLGDDGS